MDKQEIRAKSTELAIRLMGVAMGSHALEEPSKIPKFFRANEAKELFDTAVDLGKQFEAFILEAPENT
jgi:hypothetical protein